MKLGLIVATTFDDPSTNGLVPIGIGCLEAMINRELPEVEVILVETIDAMFSAKPDIVGISSSTEFYHVAIQWASVLKKKIGCPIIIGGVHISLLPESLTSDFDVAVIGEGDLVIVDLLRSIIKNNGFDYTALRDVPGLFFYDQNTPVYSEKSKLIKDLDLLPSINWIGLPFYNDSLVHIVSARGCPYKCTFCASEKFARLYRYYSADYMVNTIEFFIRDRGVKEIVFFDDLLIANKKRLFELSRMMEERGLLGACKFYCQVRANLIDDEICVLLKKLNVVGVGMGIESFSDKILRYYNKTGITPDTNQKAIDQLAEHAIKVEPSIIFCAPDETKEDMNMTMRALYRNFEAQKISGAAWGLLRPYPGTVIWDYAEERGLVSKDMDWEKFSDWANFELYLSEHMTAKEFQDFFNEWEVKFTILNFSRINNFTGNFTYSKFELLYENYVKFQAVVRDRPLSMHENELGDELILNSKLAFEDKAILLDGWYEKEGDYYWINKNAKAFLNGGTVGNLEMNIYIPPHILTDVYQGELNIKLLVNNQSVFEQVINANSFDEGRAVIVCSIPKVNLINLEIVTDKSFNPSAVNLEELDDRKLSMIVTSLSVA